MKTTLFTTLTLASSIILTSCGEKKVLPSLNLDLSGENKVINSQTLVKDEQNNSNMFCRIDSISKYGFGWEGVLAPEFQNKRIKAVITGKLRASESTKGAIVMGISNNGENKFYGSFPVENYVTEMNKWTPFKDSLYIEPEVTVNGPSHFSSFIFKPEGKGFVDMDDYSIKLEVIQ